MATRGDGKKRPMCRHCFAFIEVQATIEGDHVPLNCDGSKHRCPGAIDDERAKQRRDYLRERAKTDPSPALELKVTE